MKAVSSLGLAVLLSGCSALIFPGPPEDAGDAGLDAGGRDGGDGGSGVDAGLPLKSACTVLNSKRCEYLSRCGLIAATDPAVRDCLAWLQATSCGPSKWPARVDVGTLRYDGVTAQLCADAYATRACSDYSTEPSACSRITVPNATNLQACYDGYLECTVGVCRGTACPRSCQPRGSALPTPDVCRENPDCKPGLYCLFTGPATGVGLCAQYGAAAALCDADRPCAAGLLCSGGKCLTPPSSGQPCLGSACDDTTWCHNGPDGGVCDDRRDGGSQCTDDVQCQADYLCEVLSSQCVLKALTGIGNTCGLRQTCPLGTTCLNATATSLGECQPPHDAAGSCLSSNDCQANLACVSLDGGLALGCGPRQPAGGRCAEDRDCQLLSVCRQLSCVRLPATGDSCAITQACLFGPCGGGDAGFVCAEPFGPGVLCTKDADCSSARCVTGKCLPSCTP